MRRWDVTTMTPAIRESLVEYMRLDEGAAQLLDCAALYVEKGWTTKVNARDANGLGVCPEGPTATCWCAQGAVMAACFDLGATRYDLGDVMSEIKDRAYNAILADAGQNPEIQSVGGWNDLEGQYAVNVAHTMRGGATFLRERSARTEGDLNDPFTMFYTSKVEADASIKARHSRNRLVAQPYDVHLTETKAHRMWNIAFGSTGERQHYLLASDGVFREFKAPPAAVLIPFVLFSLGGKPGFLGTIVDDILSKEATE